MIVNEDYKFRDDIKADTIPIELLTEPYKGVIIRYTQVKIKEQEDNTAKLLFDYDVYDAGKHSEASLRKDNKFQIHIGLILNSLILEATEVQESNGNRENDTEESVKE